MEPKKKRRKVIWIITTILLFWIGCMAIFRDPPPDSPQQAEAAPPLELAEPEEPTLRTMPGPSGDLGYYDVGFTGIEFSNGYAQVYSFIKEAPADTAVLRNTLLIIAQETVNRIKDEGGAGIRSMQIQVYTSEHKAGKRYRGERVVGSPLAVYNEARADQRFAGSVTFMHNVIAFANKKGEYPAFVEFAKKFNRGMDPCDYAAELYDVEDKAIALADKKYGTNFSNEKSKYEEKEIERLRAELDKEYGLPHQPGDYPYDLLANYACDKAF